MEISKEVRRDQYHNITKWCEDSVRNNEEFLYDNELFTDALIAACSKFDFAFESLQSLLRNIHLVHVKQTTRQVKSRIKHHVDLYLRGQSILELARDNQYPPYLLARSIVESISEVAAKSRKSLTEAMRDPWTVLGTIDAIAPKYHGSERRDDGTTRLAREVSIVIEKDPMYGPRHDAERHRVGVEYETILEEVLQSLNIPFESENDLRQRGTSRTPDILLSCPFAINVGTETDERWKPVCWIDSKALFGDVKTHKESVIPQAESYVHRFGPGLLLYWFGHAPLQLLDDAQGDIAICGWDLPDQILLPTGDFVNASSS